MLGDPGWGDPAAGEESLTADFASGSSLRAPSFRVPLDELSSTGPVRRAQGGACWLATRGEKCRRPLSPITGFAWGGSP